MNVSLCILGSVEISFEGSASRKRSFDTSCVNDMEDIGQSPSTTNSLKKSFFTVSKRSKVSTSPRQDVQTRRKSWKEILGPAPSRGSDRVSLGPTAP